MHLKGISIFGSQCWIQFTARLNGQTQSSFRQITVGGLKVSPEEPSLIIIFLCALLVIIAIFLFILMRNAFLRRFKQKHFDGIDLDLIKTITNRSMLEAIAGLTRDETMEIERENIALLEALGEGAFGLVNKAVLVKDGEKHQVAVKMLKSEEKRNL